MDNLIYEWPKCIYCGTRPGLTNEHIVPKSMLLTLRIQLAVDKPDNNIASACEYCNRIKGHRFMLPTHKAIHSAYINTPTVYIVSLTNWIITYYNELVTFFNKESNLDIYEVELNDLKTVKYLYNSGYYDTLSDKLRDIPNNKFDINDIADTYHR